MNASTQLEAYVDTVSSDERVCIDQFDTDKLWLALRLRGASAFCVLNAEQARELATALNRIVEAL
jgi:hypothetical protein